MAARGVGEEGRDILFELLAREAQLLLSKEVLPFRDRKNILILAKFQY